MKKILHLKALMVMLIMLCSLYGMSVNINVPGDYSTIQAAINAAAPGSVINVAAGNYNEMLDVNKPLTILGPNATISPNGIPARAAEAVIDLTGGNQIRIAANDLILKGFKIVNLNQQGAIISGSGLPATTASDNVTIEKNLFDNLTGNAIYTVGSISNWTVTDNKIQNVSSYTTGGTYGSAMGFWLGASNVTITNNTISNCSWEGIQFVCYTTSASNITVQNNTISNILHSGMNIACNLNNVDVLGNTITNANTTTTANEGGMIIQGLGAVVDAVISGNTVSGSYNGIYVLNGFDLTGKDIVVNNNNNLSGNANKAIKNDATGTLAATCNWYGTADPAVVATKISGSVTYIPFQKSTTGPCTGGLVPAPITTIQAPTLTTGSACGFYDVPVTVKDFNDIGGIALKLNYDAAVFSYQGVTLNPILPASPPPPALPIFNGSIPGEFTMGYFPYPTISLADDAVLFTLHMKLLPAAVAGTTTNLTWNTDPGACEYAGPGYVVYVSSFFDISWQVPTSTWPVVNLTTNRGYCTIQAAIDDPATDDLAGDVDLITVDALLYAEKEQVLVNKPVTIQGINGQPTVYITGTATGKPTLFDISVNNVTIDNLHFNVDLSKLRSAIIASAADIDNITVTNNVIDCYGTPGGSYSDRNAVSINYGGTVNYRVATGGVDNIICTSNTVNAGTYPTMFRAGIAVDEGEGTFSGNTLKTINQDIVIRFAATGNVTVSGNYANGGGMEFVDFNAGSGTLSITGNNFDGTFATTYSNALRLKNNYTARTTVVSGNSFTGFNGNVSGYGGTLSLENYQAITLDNNSFTPPAGSTTYRHITVNTKDFSSSSGFYAPVVGATLTNNIFNGSGTLGGTALAFYNWDNHSPTFNAFTIGTAGNENIFNAGIGTFIMLDNSAGTVAPNATTMVPWAVNLNAEHNKFAMSPPTLPSAMTLAELFALEDKIQHKIDVSTLGFVTVVTNNDYVTPLSFLAPATTTPLIQRGVDAAGTPGWTVNVKAGSYAENIEINKAITLKGPNAGITGNGSRVSEAVIQFPVGAADESGLIYVGSNISGVTIAGFDLECQDATITGGFFGHYLILTEKVNNLTIRNNRMYSSVIPMYILTDNSLTDYRTGLMVEGNYVDCGPYVNSPYNRGIYVQATSGTIQDNQFVNTNMGIQYMPYGHTTLGTIQRNTVTAGLIGLYHNYQTNGAAQVTWSQNEVSVAPNDRAGLKAQVYGAWTQQLTFRGMDAKTFGTQGSGAAPQVSFNNNKVDGNIGSSPYYTSRIGYRTSDASATGIATLTGNSFTNLSMGAVNNSIVAVAATCNWWGTNTVSGVTAANTGNIDFDPWLTDGTDDPLGGVGFQPLGTCTGAANLYVNDLVADINDIYTTAIGSDANPGTSAAPFLTISKAVSVAVEGATIWVDAGTFQEQVFVGKTVNITGVSDTKTIIKAPVTMVSTPLSIWSPNEPVHPVVYAYGNANTVNITKLMIDGDNGRSVSRYFGALYFEANGAFTYNKITGIRDAGSFSGAQAGVAYYGGHLRTQTLAQTLTFSNNTVVDFQKGGVVVDAPGTNGTIDNNVITGQNVALVTAQNGIQLSRGAYGSIQGNTVTNCIWNKVEHPHEYTAAGILLYQAGTTTVTGNTLNGNEVGLSSSGSVGVTYGINTFNNNKIHLWLDASADVNAGNVYDKTVLNPAIPEAVFGCIQYAVDEASPSVIDVLTASAGTFAENVIVHTPVSILGPKATLSGCVARGAGEAIVVPAIADVNGEIFHVAASNVTIKGFTIDGDNPALPANGYGFGGADMHAAEGVTVYETAINNLTVTNNIFKNLLYFGVTLYDYPAGLPSSGHVISFNKFQDLGTYNVASTMASWGGGVLLYNNQYTAVTDNCMTNVRIGIQTGNFYQANPGSPACQVISGNTIEARKRGIFHNLFYSNASPYTLSGNTITALANTNETTFWDGIFLCSMATGSTVNGNIINGSGVTAIPTTGIPVWNCQVAPLISAGTISGVRLGINVNNFESYPSTGSNAGNTSATIDGVAITGSTIAGIQINDNPLNTNGAKVFAEIKNLPVGAGNVTGVLVNGSDATANIHNNSITASALGISVNGSVLSPANGLTIAANTINLTGQIAGSNPTTAIFLNKVTGTAAASITGNIISSPYYGYMVYNLNTTPATTITGGTITGIMQGFAAINIDPIGGVLRAPSNFGVSTISMSGFTGSYPGSFHAGVYVYTGGSNATDAITATVDKVSVTGTKKIAQDCAGLSFADFSTGAGVRQNITVTECTLTGNYNRGINIRGDNALVDIGTSTLTGNGFDPFGAGGNDGFGIIVRQGATATVHNCFITNPAAVTAPYTVSALFTDKGTVANATINATQNSLDQNGNLTSWLAYNAGGTINATCNWWGTAIPASIAAKINGVVTYYPSWYTTGGDLSADPGFQPAGICQGTPIALNCAVDVTEASCQSQATIDSKFAAWLATTTASGCAGTLTTTPATPAAPAACGGSTVVTWNYTSDCGILTCTKTFTVTAAPAVEITCPADVTVNQTQEKDPFATGYATATNCDASSTITYDDDRSMLNQCNATGYITRTWSVTNSCGSTATCQQKITVTDVTNPVLTACPSTITQNTDLNACTAVVTYTAPTATDFGHFQGFENAAWVSGSYTTTPSTDWSDYNSIVTRVPSLTDGIASKSGSAHAVINSTVIPAIPNDWTGAMSRLGGYNDIAGSFGNGFISSVDVFLKVEDLAVAASTYGFDLSTAVNKQSGGHLRDFVFHAAGVPGKIMIAATNNTNFARRNDLASLNHYDVTASGWYTFKWNFRNNGSDVLAVDCQLLDASGTLLWTETRSTPADVISTIVAGNRYMWFTFLAVDKLAIDNTTLTRKPLVVSAPASGTTFAVGTTPVNVTTADACGKTAACSFNVTIVDNVPPTLTCPPAILTQCVEPAAYADYAAFATAGGTATDNCTVDQSSFAFVDDVKSNETCDHRYTITRTYKIKDVNGNWNTCSQTITVNDNTAPTGTAPSGTTGINACYIDANTPPTGTPAFDPIAAAAGYSDNCTGAVSATLTGTAVTGTNCNWTVTYTFKVADGCGNELTGQTIQHTGGNTTPPTVPAFGASTVQCLSAITTPVPPTVTSCGATITPTGPVITDDPESLTCEGSRTYTYTYTACPGVSSVWKFVYTLDHTTAPVVPAYGTKTVACAAEASDPVLLVNTLDQQQLQTYSNGNWTDFTSIGQSFTCGTTGWLTKIDLQVKTLASAQSFTLKIYQGNGIDGTQLYEGSHSLTALGWQSLNIPQNQAPHLTAGTKYTFWLTSFTYNQLGLLCMNPDVYPGGVAMDGCTYGCSPTYAWQQFPAYDLVFKTFMTAVPIVTDVCGTVIPTPTPVITNTPEPLSCSGTRQYAYTYTDCSGLSTNWYYTYTVTPPVVYFQPVSAITVACGAATTSSLAYTNGLTGPCAINGSITSTLSAQVPAGACGGNITESWTYTDYCNRTINASRTIHVSPATLPTMTAPANTEVACGAIPAPSTIPFSNGLSGGCLIEGTSNPSTFSVTPDACGGNVTETWTAPNSCGRPVASVSRTITVAPATLPTMTAPVGITVTCSDLIPAASKLSFSNGLSGTCAITGTSENSTFTVTVAGNCNGKVTETWTATDACGRTLAPVSRVITINDNVPPTIICPPAVVNVHMNTGCTATGVVLGTPNVSDNCHVASVIPYVGGLEITPATYAFGFGTTTVNWVVKDDCGNTANCDQSVTVVKNTISGTLKYNNPGTKTPMNNVTLKLSDGTNNWTTTTSGTGTFTFGDLCAGDYSISVTNINKPVGYINSTDAAQVNYWGVNNTAIEHVKFLAGETNYHSGYTITSLDAQAIQNYFVFGISFPRVDEQYVFNGDPVLSKWTFWRAGENVNSNLDGNRLLNNFSITLTGDQPVDILGMGIGDFNGSFIPGATKSASSTLQLVYNESKIAGAGAQVELPVRIMHASSLGAVSLILNFPTDKMEVTGVTMKENDGALAWSVKGNELRIGWNSLQPLNFNALEDLLVIGLKTSSTFGHGDAIRLELAADPLNELADGNVNVIPDAILGVNVLEFSTNGVINPVSSGSMTLESAPNPFANYTMLTYNLPADGHVTLAINDMLGRTVTTLVKGQEISGTHSVKLDGMPLQPGVYFATVTLNNNGGTLVKTIKLVRNR